MKAGSGHGFLREELGDRLMRVARAPGLIWVHETVLAGPGDMMIDGCDVRPHVVSEYVEGGWLMPGT